MGLRKTGIWTPQVFRVIQIHMWAPQLKLFPNSPPFNLFSTKLLYNKMKIVIQSLCCYANLPKSNRQISSFCLLCSVFDLFFYFWTNVYNLHYPTLTLQVAETPWSKNSLFLFFSLIVMDIFQNSNIFAGLSIAKVNCTAGLDKMLEITNNKHNLCFQLLPKKPSSLESQSKLLTFI